MSSPKVSIGILSFNNAEYLPAAIESVLSQTFRDLELVIVDDGSTDSSLTIAESYAAKYSNIQVFTHFGHVNRGISATCNLAIEKSRGEYIALLGSDDAYYPEAMAKQVKILNENPKLGVACALAQGMNRSGNVIPAIYGGEAANNGDLAQALLQRNKISAPTVLVRRQCYEEVGLYDEKLIYSDWEMWLRILLFSRWQIGFIDEVVALYRLHEASISQNAAPIVNSEQSLLVLLQIERRCRRQKKMVDSRMVKILKQRIAAQYLEMLYFSAEKGDVRTAFACLFKSLIRNPAEIFKPRRAASILYRLGGGVKRLTAGRGAKVFWHFLS
jgi:glycosyltransferase involved in cell wall biosynthesis